MAIRSGAAWRPCAGEPGPPVRGKACGARIHVRRAARGRIDWSRVACGEASVITGFEGTAFDLSRYVPRRRKLRVWGFDDESRGVLLAATTWIPSLRAVVARARPVDTVPGRLIVEATVAELDQMYTLVEDLSDVTRGRRCHVRCRSDVGCASHRSAAR
jgi:hypothetical protein